MAPDCIVREVVNALTTQSSVWTRCVTTHMPKSECDFMCLRTYACALPHSSYERIVRRYGYKGFYDRKNKPIVLTRKVVDGIHLQGGTILVQTGPLFSSPCTPSNNVICLCRPHSTIRWFIIMMHALEVKVKYVLLPHPSASFHVCIDAIEPLGKQGEGVPQSMCSGLSMR